MAADTAQRKTPGNGRAADREVAHIAAAARLRRAFGRQIDVILPRSMPGADSEIGPFDGAA